MPTFVYMTRCDGCGHCVDICPSDIMHIDPTLRRAYNIEPNMCWECYSCVKACPHHAIDVRGYADFAPLGHSVRVHRDEENGTIAWRRNFTGDEEAVAIGVGIDEDEASSIRQMTSALSGSFEDGELTSLSRNRQTTQISSC